MNKLSLLKKLPAVEQAAQVFAVIAMIDYSWAVLRFFYRFPSWLFYSSVGEISTFFAYMIVVNLLESLFVLLAFVLLGLLLPRQWFNERFVSRSVSMILPGLVYLIYINMNYPMQASYPLAQYSWMSMVAGVIIILAFVIDKIGFLRNLLDALANRMTVFLYLIVPVSAISLFVVLIRNIF